MKERILRSSFFVFVVAALLLTAACSSGSGGDGVLNSDQGQVRFVLAGDAAPHTDDTRRALDVYCARLFGASLDRLGTRGREVERDLNHGVRSITAR